MSTASPNMDLWPDPEEANFLLSLSPNELIALDQFYNGRNGYDSLDVNVAEVQSGAVPSPEVLQVDKSHLHAIHKFLLDMNYTDEVDLSSPVLRKVFRPGYTLFTVLILYFALSIFGVVGNLVMVSSILKKNRYKRNTLACMLNISLGFWFQLIIVIPLSVFVLLVHNWVLGKFVCYLLPMVQDIPHYSLMLTILLLSVDRYKSICGGAESRIPIVWALVTAWGVAVMLVLPYSAYITYIDLSVLGESLLGGQMCFVSLTGSASQYIKALFILIYLIPSGVSLMLLILTWNELRHQEKTLQTMGIQEERRGSRDPQARRATRSSLVPLNEDEGGGGGAMDRISKRRSSRAMPGSRNSAGTTEVLLSSSSIQPGSSNTIILTEAALGLDIRKESRAQKYLLLIALVYVACLFPLNVLRIVRQIVDEKYENDGHFDYSYIIIVWVAFLPTILIPWIFTHWILIGALTTNHFGRLIRQTSQRQRSVQELAHQRRNEEAARFPEQMSWPHGPTNGISPSRRCSGLTQCAKGTERQGANNTTSGPTERELSTIGRGGHRAEHYRYNGAHSSVEPSTSQMTFEAIALTTPPQHQQKQQHSQQLLHTTSHHRQSYHEQMMRKTLPDKRALCGGGTLGQASKAANGSGRSHESEEQDHLRLESIQCFNQHQGRRKSNPSREDVQVVNKLRTGLCASNDQLNDSRRQSYCPGFHVRNSSSKNGREHRSHAHSRDDLRRHSCLPQTETDRHRNLTLTNSQPVTKIPDKQLRVSLY